MNSYVEGRDIPTAPDARFVGQSTVFQWQLRIAAATLIRRGQAWVKVLSQSTGAPRDPVSQT